MGVGCCGVGDSVGLVVQMKYWLLWESGGVFV